ncbi:ubiquitin carboxyl-terminal hydrolase 37-like [Hypomesus transpacificus]|uniref:ubiquitin carboxyl-terminal hydrolase 37-like n=1 Tax=Hypomesus transpacificus TaxID=137520 RepID=UPI001F073820|nr:ubiquitin carboxyl-terminal hydrolase 37-like [Hypomesus transpacificus]
MVPQLDWASIHVPEVQSDMPRLPVQTMQLLTSEQLQCLGLPNLSKSCYLNAAIQCMLRMGGFCQQLLQQQHIWRNNPAAGLLRCFVDVKVARFGHQPAYKRIVLKALLDCVAEEADEFRDGGQKDAHEFFCVTVAQMAALAPLLEGGAWGGGAYTCPVRTNLLFQMLSTRTCRQCGLQSSRQEEFSNLSLALTAGSSVEACLQQYLQETELEFRCSCGGCRSGLRWSFLTLPQVIVFQLNRFCHGAQWQLEKLEEPILLSRELLLCSGPSGDKALPSRAAQEQGQTPGGQGHTQEQGQTPGGQGDTQAGTGVTQLTSPHASELKVQPGQCVESHWFFYQLGPLHL